MPEHPTSSSRTSLADRVRAVQYRFYFYGTAFNYFLRRRIRPAGIGLLILIIIASCVAAGNAETSVFQIFACGVSLAFVSLLWLPFRRARLEVRRVLPAHATAGIPLVYGLEVRNLGPRRYHRLGFAETPPDPRPDAATFIRRREPGERERNFFDRFFAYYRWNWLCEKRLPFEGGQGPPDASIDRSGLTRLTLRMLPNRRGLIRLDDLRVLLPDPLGFFQRCPRVKAPADTLAVLPHRYPLPAFELPGSARFQPGADATSRNPGPSGEFIGLRDYQPGDPLRLIHWPSWARTGRPVVKELEDTFFPRHGLILDTFPEAGDDDLFEAAVSVAASFVSAVDTRESLIDLMFIAGAERVVSAGHGVGRSELLLEVLAGVESTAVEDFAGLSRLVLRHSEDLAGALCVFAGWSPSRAHFLETLRRAGIECAALVISREAGGRSLPRVHRLHPATLARDLMKLPPVL